MLPKLTQRLLDDWDNLFPQESRPDFLSYLGIAGSIEGGTTTFLGFPKNKGKPLFAVKVHRMPNQAEQAFKERDILIHLHNSSDLLAQSVPRAILCECLGGVWMLIQSVLGGRLMSAHLTEEGTPDLAEAAVNFDIASNWLIQMHSATRKYDITGGARLRQEIVGNLEEFLETFELSAKEKERVAKLSEALGSWPVGDLYLRHGDFCRHNILIDSDPRKKIGVIDWTFSGRTISPLDDFFFFLATYFLQIREGFGITGLTKAFDHTFFKSNGYSELVGRSVKDFCQRLDIDLLLARDVFSLFLINRAMFERRQLLECSISSGLPRFAVYIAASQSKSYQETFQSQLWIRFFKFFVECEHLFIL